MQEFIQIPTEYIEQVLEKTSGVRPNLQDEFSLSSYVAKLSKRRNER